MSEDQRIRVSARLRPLSAQEEERGESIVVHVQDAHTVVAWEKDVGVALGPTPSRGSLLRAGQAEVASPTHGRDQSEPGVPSVFGFDATFDSPPGADSSALQEHVYEQIGRPALQDAMEGVSGCLFAYGISGSGKTFSLLGSQESPGVLPRLARELLEAKCEVEAKDNGEECSIKAAFLELYNENLVDLLSDSREPLRLFESSREGVVVPGLSEMEVSTPDEFSNLLDFATCGRTVGATCVNAHSSRSHMLIQLRVQRTGKQEAARAKIHVIDLAGSERQKRARSEGTRMKEGIHINVSLSALGLVISRLSEIAQGRGHCSVPYRDSKLTFLLKDSLSGSARTQVLVALSPGSSNYEESLSSLRFAQSVKRIRTRAVADVVTVAAPGGPAAQRELQAMRAEVDRLRTELRMVRACILNAAVPASPTSEERNAGEAGQVDEAVRRLEGRYVSPSGRPIEVLPDGSVHFLGGGGHHPIRILPAVSSSEGDGCAGGRVRLECEGDPAYRYTLATEDEDGTLVWSRTGREEEEEGAEAKEVRWERSYGARRRPSSFSAPESEAGEDRSLSPPPRQKPARERGREENGGSGSEEALKEAQLASRSSPALARASRGVPALVKALRPSAALEAIEALVLLCQELDEVNGALETASGLAPEVPPRLEATWLPPDLHEDLTPRELLHVRVPPQAAGASPEVQRQVWPLAEFHRRLEAFRGSASPASSSSSPVEELELWLARRRLRSFWGVAEAPVQAQGRPCSHSPPPTIVPAAVVAQPRAWSPGAEARTGSLEPPQSRLQAARASRARRNSGSPSPSSAWPLLGSPTHLQRGLAGSRSFADVSSAQQVGDFANLRGSFRSKSGVGIQVMSDGRVDFGGMPLQLSREGAKVLLRSPEDTMYGPYRLLGRDSAGVLRWELDVDADIIEAAGLPAGDDGEGGSPIAWTPAGGGAQPPGSMVPPIHVLAPPGGDDEAPQPAQGPQRRHSHVGLEASPRTRPPALPLQLRPASGGGSGSSTPAAPLTGGRFGRQPISQQSQRPRSADPCRGRGRSRAAVASRERPNARRPRSPTPAGVGGPACSDRRAFSATGVRPKLGVAAGPGDPCVAAKAFDKNSLRLRNGSIFVDALARWRQCHAQVPSAPQRRLVPGLCTVFVRKRPMFERDTRRCDFDVLTVVGSGAEGGTEGDCMGQEIVHHTCMFDRSLVTPLVMHTQFPFDGVFDADASNEDVYNVVGRPLLENALDGNLATLFMFGQTGSGKTYTMRQIERLAAEELFFRLGEGAQVSLTYFELAGRKALDLLTEQKTEIRLREEEDGCFRPHDCEEAVVGSAEELLRVMGEAAGRRATDATTVNASSSRSHAVCRISLARDRKATGRLLLVDCAGTERSRDTLFFKGQNVKESAEINSSLFALKDCIRSRQAAIHRQSCRPQDGAPLKLPSVRATPLTKVLAESLISASAQLAAMATVSPNATDAEHTIDTLRTVYTLSGRGERCVAEFRQVLE